MKTAATARVYRTARTRAELRQLVAAAARSCSRELFHATVVMVLAAVFVNVVVRLLAPPALQPGRRCCQCISTGYTLYL
jgi:hypothetical protein